MGNRAKRIQLAQALKEAGVHVPLYYGNKKVAWRALRSKTMDFLLGRIALKPGTVVNDCDRFNHEIKRPLIDMVRWSRRKNNATWVIHIDQFEFTDGRWSCGCPDGPVSAWTVEQITAYHRDHSDEDIEGMKKGGWWTEKDQAQLDRWRAGESVCDEQGFRIPEGPDAPT